MSGEFLREHKKMMDEAWRATAIRELRHAQCTWVPVEPTEEEIQSWMARMDQELKAGLE